MKQHLRLAVATVAVGLAVAAAGCGGGVDTGGSTSRSGSTADGGDAAQTGGSLAVGLDSEATSLDPAGDTGYAAANIEPQIFDTLTTVDEEGVIQPGLAKAWKRQDGGRTYVLELEDGVTFHDGTPFDAAAVKFNLERAAKGGSPWAADLEPIQEIEVVDDTTVRLRLREPYAPLLSTLADRPGMMASPTAVKKLGEKFGLEPVGTGPFAFKSWTRNDRLELVRNEDYWRKGEPYLDSITFRPLPDPTQKVTALLSGTVQTVDYVPPEAISRLESAADIELEQGPGPYNSVVYMPLNPDKAPLDDPEVRQAIAMSIDRDSLVENVSFGVGTPARSVLSPTSWGYSDAVPAIPYDPEKAKELLGGRELSFELQVPPTYAQYAQVMKQNLAEAGIDVRLRRMDWGQLIDRFYEGQFEMQVQDLLGMQRSDPDGALSAFYDEQGGINSAGYTDPTFERLLAEGRQSDDEARRKEIYAELQRHAQDVSIYIPIVIPGQVRAWASSVEGLQLTADGVLHLGTVSVG